MKAAAAVGELEIYHILSSSFDGWGGPRSGLVGQLPRCLGLAGAQAGARPSTQFNRATERLTGAALANHNGDYMTISIHGDPELREPAAVRCQATLRPTGAAGFAAPSIEIATGAASFSYNEARSPGALFYMSIPDAKRLRIDGILTF